MCWRRALLVLAALSCVTASAAAQEPELDYVQFCAGCHGFDGSGSAQNDVPDMRGVISRFTAVPSGRAFLVQVAGVAQAPLDHAALARLLNWLLVRMDPTHLPEHFEPYTAREIAQLRASRPGDLMALRDTAVGDLAKLAGSHQAKPVTEGP